MEAPLANLKKQAQPDHPVHKLIAQRWSPYGFDDKPVSRDDLKSILEAARWAASAFNEQPWCYILGVRGDDSAYDKVLSCLVEGNQSWAQAAPVLLLGVARTVYSRNGKPNGTAFHDLGLSSANLVLEATARGLYVHQMGGVLPDKAREVFGIPEEYQVLTGLAVGYAADPATMSDPLKERDLAPRTRRSLDEFVFEGKWGQAAK
jgi:nitroreductase